MYTNHARDCVNRNLFFCLLQKELSEMLRGLCRLSPPGLLVLRVSRTVRMYIQTCLWNLPFMLIFLCLTSHAQTSPPDTTQTICVGKLRGIRFRLIDEAKQWQGAGGRILLTLSSVCDTAWPHHLCGLSRLHRTGWNTEFKVGAQNAADNSLYISCSSFDSIR